MTREKLLFLHAEQLCREQPFLGSMISWSTDWKVISHFGRMFCKIHLETWCDSTGATNRDPIALTISWAWLGGVPILGSLPKIIIAIDGRNCRQTSLLVLSKKRSPIVNLILPDTVVCFLNRDLIFTNQAPKFCAIHNTRESKNWCFTTGTWRCYDFPSGKKGGSRGWKKWWYRKENWESSILENKKYLNQPKQHFWIHLYNFLCVSKSQVLHQWIHAFKKEHAVVYVQITFFLPSTLKGEKICMTFVSGAWWKKLGPKPRTMDDFTPWVCEMSRHVLKKRHVILSHPVSKIFAILKLSHLKSWLNNGEKGTPMSWRHWKTVGKNIALVLICSFEPAQSQQWIF